MIGIFGGTFDPVHLGHLRSALEIYSALELDHIRFIPCANPSHRQKPVASVEMRMKMVAAAIAPFTGFVLDSREANRSGPSYMYDTLVSLKKDFTDQRLCLIIGADAFLMFNQWKQWEEILKRCHLLVMERPGTNNLQDAVTKFSLELNFTNNIAEFKEAGPGSILSYSVTQLGFSSSKIRQFVQADIDVRYCVTDDVYKIINQENLYK